MSLFDELKRRNVFRVALAYLVIGWLLTEVLTTILPTLGAPDWAARRMSPPRVGRGIRFSWSQSQGR
jgi:hypothetical protein